MDRPSQPFSGILTRSRLFSQSEAVALCERWAKEAKGASSDFDQFLKWLVGKQFLTEYQAEMLGRGHTDGFFLQQYKILDRIGRGRMAGVYKAVHNLGHLLAIKVLPPSRARKPLLMARFQREARLALRLRHPNVVRAYQVGEAEGVHYLVMEYLEGETLEDVLQRRSKLPVIEAVRVIYQALLGLQHLHEQSLVHRDLKPANLMLVPVAGRAQPDTTLNTIVKILDIGLGRVMYDESEPERAEDPRITETGVLLGTPDYMAPEQGKDARLVDVRSDIYSLGCVLYHALTSRPPFPDVNMVSQLIRHATEPLGPARSLNPEVPEGLEQVLGWMLAKEPAQRYPTPERAAQALQVFLASAAAEAQEEEIPLPKRSYLNWLESAEAVVATVAPNVPKAPAKPMAIPAAPPLAAAEQPAPRPAAAIPLGKPAIPLGKSAQPGVQPGQRPRGTAVAASAAPALARERPRGGDAEEYDVELVPVTAPIGGVSDGNDKFVLSVRDFLMLGIGAGGVLVAVFVGWLLALVFRKKEPAAPPKSDMPADDKEN
jgi:serine/threonine protein kinase